MNAARVLAPWAPPVASIEPARLVPGAEGRLVITLDVPEGCHVQSHRPSQPFLVPTTLSVDPPGHGLELGQPTYPDGEVERYGWTDVALTVYRGTVRITVPVRAMADWSGTSRLTARLRYQGCTESACLPPVELPVEVLVVSATPASASPVR